MSEKDLVLEGEQKRNSGINRKFESNPIERDPSEETWDLKPDLSLMIHKVGIIKNKRR